MAGMIPYKPEDWIWTRARYLRTLSDKGLAEYLTRELADVLPADWAAWLNEEVTFALDPRKRGGETEHD